ncbi:hypothetical protein FA048_12555 [Pedobacter polaris]|uniref:DUF4294 domain-containing protein n=1 Tax=Pedobacter polaris TaxID=2571273 RepID=A0A4U1CLR2_9SPHI|nr:hypothetical protein [Pedobacter polaris]TKC07989.1 hypothetical protein FA048_12555 [Pedobacter polaris]
MKTFSAVILLSIITLTAKAQVHLIKQSSIVKLDDGRLYYTAKSYIKQIDSLDKVLVKSPNDTTALMLRSFFYLKAGDLLANPYAADKIFIDRLLTGKRMIEKALSLKLIDLKAKIIAAELCNQLSYRYGGYNSDLSWKYDSKTLAKYAAFQKRYKEEAIEFYKELAVLDKNSAWEYQKKMN